MLVLSGLSAYWENALPAREAYSGMAEQPAVVAKQFRESFTQQFRCVINPINATGRLTINKTPDVATPRYDALLNIDAVNLVLQDDQYVAILKLAEGRMQSSRTA